MTAYYNEHDPFAAAWLRELIADNLIAPGEVDERSIEDVTPDDLRPFQQCHFFAGIGVWSLAARRAGIADDAPLWSGSCPCQPFSAAGKGGGFADERHLWPAFHYLIEQCQPALVVGEQVAGADGDAWFDLVSADLDAAAYAFGVAETCAAGFGAPHIRTRNYWVAVADCEGSQGRDRSGYMELHRGSQSLRPTSARGFSDRLADAELCRRQQQSGERPSSIQPEESGGRIFQFGDDGSSIRGLADDELQQRSDRESGVGAGDDARGRLQGATTATGLRRVGVGHNRWPGPVNGLWADADWLRCRDEKWRPVESGTFPLVDAGAFRNRVGLLRGAGNAITLGQAQGFLEAVCASI